MKFSKIVLSSLVALMAVFGILSSQLSFADATYPWTNPSYVPTAVSPPATYTAPAMYNYTIAGIDTLTIRVSGTCTSLAATLQATNDGTNYTAINLYPIATGTTAPTAVASISAVGFWKANTSGYTKVRLNISALTATCTVAMAGDASGFNGTQF